VRQIFQDNGMVMIVRNHGLSVAEISNLRARMRECNTTVKVVKNRLAKIAIEGTPGAVASDLFTGPTALVYTNDAVPAAKVATEFAKTNQRFDVLGAILGESLIDHEGVKALSELPSLDELRAKLVGALNAPGSNFVRTLNAPGEQFARTLNAPAVSLAAVLSQRQSKLEAA